MCETCGKPLTDRRADARACSGGCRAAANRRKARQFREMALALLLAQTAAIQAQDAEALAAVVAQAEALFATPEAAVSAALSP